MNFFTGLLHPRGIASDIKDDLENFLYERMISLSPIQVTVSSGKVYVGVVQDNGGINPKREWFTIVPTQSGYRNEHQQVTYTEFYDEIEVSQTDDQHKPRKKYEDLFSLTIPKSKIVSVSNFDKTVYKQFLEKREKELIEDSEKYEVDISDLEDLETKDTPTHL